MKSFRRFYVQFYQNYMKSLIRFVHRPDLDLSAVFIILHKYRGVVDEYALNRTASLLPGLLFVIELENYDKNYHFVNVYANTPLLIQSLQIVRPAWCINFKRDFPNSKPKLIFSRNLHLIWSVDDQERRIGKT